MKPENSSAEKSRSEPSSTEKRSVKKDSSTRRVSAAGHLQDVRRLATLVVSVLMLLTALATWWFYGEQSGASKFVAAACGRIGLVLGALWLAWPQLKKPAKWLPASAPVIGIVALIVIAAQPRLLIPAIPIVGALITLSAFVKAFRR